MEKYHILIRIMHWTVGILVIGMLILGYNMDNMPNEMKGQVYGLHKAVGCTIFALMGARIMIRLSTTQPPALKQIGSFGKVFDLFSKFVHIAFYFLILAASVSGYIMSAAAGRTVKWFFDVEIPMFVAKNPELASAAKSAHGFIMILILCLLALHIIGFLKHLIIDKENILKRII